MAEITNRDWRTLVRRTGQGKLLPILSDDVTSGLIFDKRQLIQAWSDDIDYPMGGSFSLTRLAQYLSIEGNDDLAAKEEFLAFLKSYYVNLFETELATGDAEAALNGNMHTLRFSELVDRLNRAILDDEDANPIRRLAQLPVEIYITTSYHNFLEQALHSIGKQPRVEICYWDHRLKGPAIGDKGLNQLVKIRDALEESFDEEELRDLAFQLGIDFSDLPGEGRKAKARELAKSLDRQDRLSELVPLGEELRPRVPWADIVLSDGDDSNRFADYQTLASVFDVEPTYVPSADEPLIYHLLGIDAFPSSLVLTEDDHLDFLVNVSADKHIIPPRIKQALSDSSLVLLGYQLPDWDFRVLFRGLIARRRSVRRRLSLAIQLEPEVEETDHADELTSSQSGADSARSYMAKYLLSADIQTYWGTPRDFVQELWSRWELAQ